MKTKTKLTAVLLAAVLAFSVLVSCTPKNDDHSGQVTIPSDTSAPASERPTDAPGSEMPETTPDATEPAQSDAPATDGPAETESPTPEATEAPTATPVPATATPAPATNSPSSNPPSGDTVSIGSSSKPARFTMPTDLYGVSEYNCEQWFSDAVFIGDSISLGWQNYNNKMLESNPSFFGNTHFLCSGSYGVGHAFDPISEDSLHPRYQGEQHFVWDSVSMMGANKVFILLGMNDISIYGVDGTASRYSDLITNIIEHRPGVQIFVISNMYMYRGSEREKLNNRNIYLLNQRLVQMCNENGYEFVNIASHLIDEDGFVPDQYSSDHYVHQTYAAYAVWAQILRSVAARHIQGIPPIVFSLP
jgi:Lysophospholipase L1 and related esterases